MIGKEFVICSAVWFKNGKSYPDQPLNIQSGYVICGRRHNNCYASFSIMRGDIAMKKPFPDCYEGFLTSNDRFVNRFEGYEIAKSVGQILYENSNNFLTSENLFYDNE